MFKLSFTLFLFIASSALAQVPAGPMLWLRADAGVNIENGYIASWSDQSISHNDAVQTDTTQRPTLLMNGLNGLPTVHFDGGSFFNAPGVFPRNEDYSVSGVIRLSDTTQINNILSGNTHAIWFNSSCYLQFHHYAFPVDGIASAPINPNGSCFTLIYNSNLSTVKMYIDGLLTDSLWVESNSDSLMYIGSFEQAYVLHGDISELLMYNRQLTSSEANDIDHYMETKYGLSVRAQLPLPDSTFSQIPREYQFFPRNSQDSAAFPIAGTLRTTGFDSMYVETLCNGTVKRRSSMTLAYVDGTAKFLFQSSIHAELSEYAIRVGAVRNGVDSILTTRDSLVCGDAFLISGQSNAFIGFQKQGPANQYCRTFGVEFNHNARDTQWSIAISVWPGYYNCVCAWSFQLAQCITDSIHLPVCIIDGALPGGKIEQLVRNDSNPLDMNTAYGLMLFRTIKAGLQNSIRAIGWDQGEWNSDTNYLSNFTALRAAWLEDYPSVEKIYVVQQRPNGCATDGDQRKLRELQRRFPDLFPNLIDYSFAALPQFDGCHLGDSGYHIWGTQIYSMFARDLYHGTDTLDISSPDIHSAFYTTPAHNEIKLVFSPDNGDIALTSDTVVYGALRKMINYFYLDDSSDGVQSIQTDGNSLLLSVNNPSAKTITYLPDAYYPDYGGIYVAPWIVNKQGLAALIWYDFPVADQPPSRVEDQVAINDVQITPNPTTNEISLDASQYTGPIEASLMSETGAEVWRKSIPAGHPNQLTFDLASESSGCYLLRLSDGISSRAWKFILER